MKFYFIWSSDEHATIYLGSAEIGEIDHGAHGWDGMHAVQDVIDKIAGELNIPVVHYERYEED